MRKGPRGPFLFLSAVAATRWRDRSDRTATGTGDRVRQPSGATARPRGTHRRPSPGNRVAIRRRYASGPSLASPHVVARAPATFSGSFSWPRASA